MPKHSLNASPRRWPQTRASSSVALRLVHGRACSCLEGTLILTVCGSPVSEVPLSATESRSPLQSGLQQAASAPVYEFTPLDETSWIGRMALKRMDNVGIVVDDLAATIDFFRELGLELEGRATIEGEWAGRVTGLGDQRVEIAMMRTPDGHSRLELSRFLTPPVVADHRNAPVNALGYLRVMFAVDDIDETLERLRTRGAQLVGEVVQYEDAYRLCYIRGPEGLLIGLAEELS